MGCKLTVQLAVQEQVVQIAKGTVAQKQSDFEHAGNNLRIARDHLHDAEVRLVTLREELIREGQK